MLKLDDQYHAGKYRMRDKRNRKEFSKKVHKPCYATSLQRTTNFHYKMSNIILNICLQT